MRSAGQVRSYSLSLITAWHLKEARYPAGETGYWDPKAYGRVTPFVKEMPALIRHAETAVNSAIEASEIAKDIADA